MNYYNEFDPKAAAWLRELIQHGLIPNGTVDERSIAEVQPGDLQGYTQCHFFAGIGGWSRALELAGWPSSRPVWTGSCPCQPFSAAGKQRGESDERHLWPEFLRLIAACRPTAVAGEQVASKLGREWLSRVRADLEALGYGVGAADLCASGVGAPHIRQRLYWMAYSSGERRVQIGREASGNHQENGVWTGDWIGNGGKAGWLGESNRNGRNSRGQASSSLGHGDSTEPAVGSGRLANTETAPRNGSELRHHSISDRGIADAWSDFDIIPCRDGKSRRVGVRFQLLVDGIRCSLGSGWENCSPESKQEAVTHAKESERRPSEILPIVQTPSPEKENDAWKTGGHVGFHSQEVLRQKVHGELHGGEDKGSYTSKQSEAVSETEQVGVSGLREVSKNSRPSRGLQSTEQCSVKFEDIMRLLPSACSLAAIEGDAATIEALYLLFPSSSPCWNVQHSLFEMAKTWRCPDRSQVERVWRSGGFKSWGLGRRSVLRTGVSGRVGLLRGYGNAIVPQVAAEFIKAFTSAVGDLTHGANNVTVTRMAKTKKFCAEQSEFFPEIVRAEQTKKLTNAIVRILSNPRWIGAYDVQIGVLDSISAHVSKLKASADFAAQQVETGSANGVVPQ